MAANTITPQSPFRPPVETPVTDKNGKLTWDWSQHLQIAAAQLQTPANQTPPASAGQIGKHGQISVSNGFLYAYDQTVGRWIKFAPVPF